MAAHMFTAHLTAEGRIRAAWDEWSVYAFFSEPLGKMTLCKIGITRQPLERFTTLREMCALPMRRAVFANAGSRSIAARIEAAALKRMEAYRTRGEWSAFDLEDPAAKATFADATKRVFFDATGRTLHWHTVTPDMILAEQRRIRALATSRGLTKKLAAVLSA